MSSTIEVYLDEGPKKIYKRAEEITGKIRLINDHELENCQRLVLTLIGEEEVHWSERHYSNSQNKKSSLKEHKFECKRTIFELENIIWSSKTETETVEKGEKEFDFSISLPDEIFPSTMKSDYGKVKYYLNCSMEQQTVPKNDKEWKQLENILELTPVYDFSKKVDILVNGCQVDTVLINMDKRNSPVIQSLELNEGFFIGKITMSLILNRDTFFTGEKMNLQVILCNGTSKFTDIVKYEFIKLKEYLYSRKTVVGKIKRRKEHIGIISSGIVASQTVEHSRYENSIDIEVPIDLKETTMMKDAIFRVSYSLKITFFCSNKQEKIIEFPVYIINSDGCPFQRKVKKIEKKISEISVDDFEMIDENVGFLDLEDREIDTEAIKNSEKNEEIQLTFDESLSTTPKKINFTFEKESLDILSDLINE
eukprot:gene9269-1356_t